MSRVEWGIFLTSRPTVPQCRQVIINYNQLLRRLGLPEEVILGVEFGIHPTFDNTKGNPWFWGIYLRLDERAEKAIQMLPLPRQIQGMHLSTRL
jgi:hypothetical protein